MQKAKEYGKKKTSNRCFLISFLITGRCTLKPVCLNRLQTLQNAGIVHGGCQTSRTPALITCTFNFPSIHHSSEASGDSVRCSMRPDTWTNDTFMVSWLPWKQLEIALWEPDNLITATFSASKSLRLRPCVIVLRWAKCFFVAREKI